MEDPIACRDNLQRCAYFEVTKGRTNLNQKEEDYCYSCRMGQFWLTRRREELPRKCPSPNLRTMVENFPLQDTTQRGNM